MKDSQQKRIMNLLEQERWVCTNELYALWIADPRKRLCELRDKGVKMEWRWCEHPGHNHDGQSKEWRLLREPEQRQLI